MKRWLIHLFDLFGLMTEFSSTRVFAQKEWRTSRSSYVLALVWPFRVVLSIIFAIALVALAMTILAAPVLLSIKTGYWALLFIYTPAIFLWFIKEDKEEKKEFETERLMWEQKFKDAQPTETTDKE